MRTLSNAFDLVKRAAKHDPQITKYRHSAAIVSRRGELLTIGRNYYDGSTVETEEGVFNKTIHAEINALSKVAVRKLGGATLLSYGRTDVSAILARPCGNCWAVLKKLGFRRVFYTTYVGGYDADVPTWKEEIF